jgi:hypothetical protein
MAQEGSEAILRGVFRYRQILTWASVISSVSILLTFWAWFPKDESRLLAVLALLPLLLPYAFIPLRLYSQRLRSGLNLAIAMGGALFVPGIMLVRFALTWDRRWWVVGNLFLASLMQLVLLVLAVKTYIPLPRLRHARLKSLVSMAYGFLLFVLFWLFYSPVPVSITRNESAAIEYLEHSAASAEQDAREHGGLFAEAVGSSEPNSHPECTVAPRLMNYVRTTGYLFEYRGIQPSSKSQGCTRFKGFTVTGRPAVYRQTGIRSFCIRNGDPEIHFTSENRPAKDSDPHVYVRHAPN